MIPEVIPSSSSSLNVAVVESMVNTAMDLLIEFNATCAYTCRYVNNLFIQNFKQHSDEITLVFPAEEETKKSDDSAKESTEEEKDKEKEKEKEV